MEEDSTANALQTETWREDGLTSHPINPDGEEETE
jgi:hypothetical protein